MEQTPAMSLTKKSSILGDVQQFWDKPHATQQIEVAESLDIDQI
jgi:hypothetical protein